MLLVKMTQGRYAQSFRSTCIAELATQCVDNGRWPESGALERAEREQDQTLPQGVETKDHHLFTLRDDDGYDVGSIWFGRLPGDGGPIAFLFLVHVEPAHRGKGRASAALRRMEEMVADLGMRTIRLHVFSANQSAVRLYRCLGYVCLRSEGPSMIMEKELDAGPGEAHTKV